MKFRIKHVEGIGYFGQVKHGWFSSWQTIGEHVHGYGLYPNNRLDHPLDTFDAAVKRCKDYMQYEALVVAGAVAYYGLPVNTIRKSFHATRVR